MNLPAHLFRLVPARPPAGEAVDVVRRTDVQWGAPLFRAPALPTPHQLSNELPFTVNLHANDRHPLRRR
ncbi:MAG TPA: hypothetical protein VHD62_03395 [Opitutaceae bacterium]|nr:hypothetical protein [Opitutaceae bacterium]